MDKTRAVKLLDDTFRTNFDLNQFSLFIKELFNKITINIQDKTPYIAKQFNEYIAECKKIAKYEDSSKKSMEVLAVKLKRTTSRDRARIMQRNFVSSWLSNYDIDAALVAFYGDDNEDWRFSYVKMEYNLVKNEDEKVIIEKELTPAKRYSFLVGKNEPNHTCQKQFLDLVIEEKTNPSIGEIEQAFSVEKVTKEFFEEYKELAINLKESMDKILSKDSRIKTEFDNKGISTIDFSKKLLGQIVFLYFLQKKGWLGVQKQPDGTFGEWGTGPKKFLRELFDKRIVQYDNFFNDMLEPLFYEALANDRSADNDYYSRFKCKIPFLNGGLFEPLNDYDWTGTDIKIPNELFSNFIRTQAEDVGTGILDVFDRYNFTVKEDEPLEKEVAVDPEMLGKIFENLLDVKDRKDKGAFYTPREIVHYMCQQSLINYLETNTSGVPREDIERFIQYGDIALDLTVRSLIKKETYPGKSFVNEKLLVPKSISDNYQKIDKLLQDIKIVDPAVGSGAFPVGMMNEIVKARSILTLFFPTEEQKERTEYNLKRQCIENCLYGVDIDPSAVEIAKLRFWLSLIVDEEKKEDIQPLPNLDHKIMCGNSLLEEFEGIKLFDERLLGEIAVKTPTEVEIDSINEQILKLNDELKDIRFGYQRPEIKQKIEQRETLKKRREILEKRLEKEKRQKDKDSQITIDQALEHRIKESQIKLSKLKTLQKEFFNEQNRNKKKKLREEIDKIEWELIEATLEEQGHEEALAKLEQYKKTNVKPFFLWKLYFAEVFQRENPGFDVVIANPPYIEHKKLKEFSYVFKRNYSTYSGTADLYVYFYEQGFNILNKNGVLTFITSNKFIKTKYGKKLKQYLSERRILELIDFTDVHVFEALVASCILICKNSLPHQYSFRFTKVKDDFSLKTSINKYLENQGSILQNDRLDGENWRLDDESLFKIKEKLESIGKKIKSVKSINVFRGVTTGYNPAFIIDEEKRKELLVEDPANTRIIKPLLQGRNIRKWVFNTSGEYLIFIPWHFPLHLDASVSGPSLKAEKDFKENYPSIYEHLKKFKKELSERNKDETGIRYEWYALQRCAASYYNEFEKEKIVWGLTADKWAFAYDNNKHYLPSNGYILTSKEINIKLILGQLNSKVLQFYFSLIGIMTAGGAYTLKHETIIEFPILFNTSIDDELINLVDEILKITQSEDYINNQDKIHQVTLLEKRIDSLLYAAYQLTSSEIKLIEETLKNSK